MQITISKRSAFMIVLAFLLVVPAVAFGSDVFDDVSDTSVHADGIGFMQSSGVSVGCDATNYCPGDTVTRAQMGTFLYRLSGNDPATPPSVNAASAMNPIAVAGSATGVNITTSTWTEVGTVDITIPEGITTATLVATFGAETACSGGVGFIIGPWCAARMLIDGVEMTPTQGVGFALDSSDAATETLFSWEAHSFQRYAVDIAPGVYTVTVEVSGQGTTPPTFAVGDWTLVVTGYPTS